MDEHRQAGHDYAATWARGEGTGMFGLPANHAERMAMINLEAHNHTMAALDSAGRSPGGQLAVQSTGLPARRDPASELLWMVLSGFWVLFLALCAYVVYASIFKPGVEQKAGTPPAKSASHKVKKPEHHRLSANEALLLPTPSKDQTP